MWKPITETTSGPFFEIELGHDYTKKTDGGVWVPKNFWTGNEDKFQAAVMEVANYMLGVKAEPAPSEYTAVGYNGPNMAPLVVKKNPVIFTKPRISPAKALRAIIPEITHVERCPVKQVHRRRCDYAMDLASVIIHLNDDHRWSREKIADWLDRLPVDLTIKPSSEGD